MRAWLAPVCPFRRMVPMVLFGDSPTQFDAVGTWPLGVSVTPEPPLTLGKDAASVSTTVEALVNPMDSPSQLSITAVHDLTSFSQTTTLLLERIVPQVSIVTDETDGAAFEAAGATSFTISRTGSTALGGRRDRGRAADGGRRHRGDGNRQTDGDDRCGAARWRR